MKQLFFIFMLSLAINLSVAGSSEASDNDWFEMVKLQVRQSGDATDLYRLLYFMPKGGDLHNHFSGSGYSEWWYELALMQEARGYLYYTRVQLDDCPEVKAINKPILFRNITALEYKQLVVCEKNQYKPLKNLSASEKLAWQNSIRLDQPNEGREEFFERHWQRLNALNHNPWLKVEILIKNMQAFAAEGLSYIEFQTSLTGFSKADGQLLSEDEVANIYRQRLKQADALKTAITIRFQSDLLRFQPDAEMTLAANFEFVDKNPDYWVGINMVGREDNQLGQPLRFKKIMQQLRAQYSTVKISLHAGESEYANSNVKDSLLLGADRIGHGLNLIHDQQTLQQMRHGSVLIEINLISNLLLGYVNSYQQHPFPDYLRLGIPVALSTDDRGMWDSTMTDEFFVAVTEFDLSWPEVKLLSRNSLEYAFIKPELKQRLLTNFEEKIALFEQQMKQSGIPMLGPMPETRGFICRRYQLCY